MEYTISPYIERSAIEPVSENEVAAARLYLDQRFTEWHITNGGREAIKIALSKYGLMRDDVVTILTTSGNFYISSCVTNAIESFCNWSRKITEKTKLIFVNHEFGYPYEGIEELKKYGVPIIEDCAYDFFSESMDGNIGKVGDFAIFSLPKALPVESGGILVVNNPVFSISRPVPLGIENRLLGMIGRNVPDMDRIREKRLRNYHFLLDCMSDLGIEPFFQLNDGVVPGVLLFRWRDDIDYPALKTYMQSHGVECSVFYGEYAFFIPLHQNLREADMLHICNLIRDFNNHV